MPMVLKVLQAVPGTERNGRFKPAKKNAKRARARNVEYGFHDAEGRFHPIRASSDYEVGATAKKKAAKKKAKGKAKAKAAKKGKAKRR